MSYCVNCGVELAEYIKKCPLCHTEVINPNQPYDFASEPPYPEYQPAQRQPVSPKTVLTILGLIFMLPIAICVIADIMISSTVTWSGYVLAALFCIYTILCSAMLVHKESAVLEQLFDYMAIVLLAAFIESQSGGAWFLTFALPLIGIFAVGTILLTVASKAFHIQPLGICGAYFIFLALFTICCDLLICYNFFGMVALIWSPYSFASLLLIGTLLLFIQSNKPLKRWLDKKFFI